MCANLISIDSVKERILAKPNTYILILFGNVYDVSPFADMHPGGLTVIKNHNGKECGDIFMRIHGLRARNMLRDFYLGPLEGGMRNGPPGLVPGSTPSLKKTDSPALPPNIHECRLLELSIAATTRHIRYLRFAYPEPLNLIPGGHIKIFSDVTQQLGRFYTPYTTDMSSFTVCVKRYPGGQTSSHLFTLKEGDTVYFEGPFPPKWVANKDVVLNAVSSPKGANAHVLLVAGGTGLSPLYAIAKDLLVRRLAQVTLVCCANTRAEMLLTGDIKELQQMYSKPDSVMTYDDPGECFLRLFFVLTQSSETVSWADGTFHEYLNEASLMAMALPLDTVATVVCGPPTFNTAVSKAVVDAKVVTQDRVHVLF